LRILCDANIGSFVANKLDEAGHDIERAALILRGASDEKVLEHAVTEKRVLLTCDRDFGELVFNHGRTPPPAIIYVRFDPPDVREIVPRILAAVESGNILGNMTVIREKQDRRTPLPQADG
jgi:predicted nuclease of predicted toxin-antitoxin system